MADFWKESSHKPRVDIYHTFFNHRSIIKKIFEKIFCEFYISSTLHRINQNKTVWNVTYFLLSLQAPSLLLHLWPVNVGRPFQRKLTSLGYHAADNIDVSSPADLRALVVWLEDQKIRHYKIEDRSDLHQYTGDNWTGVFKKYLKDLECPFSPDTQINSVVDWLLGVAVRYEFNEACETNPHLRRGLSATPTTTAAKSSSALDINPSDETFQRGVAALAQDAEGHASS